MRRNKRSLYKKAEKIYRIKLAATSEAQPYQMMSYYAMPGQQLMSSPIQGATTAMPDKWWRVSMAKDPWALAGGITMAIPGAVGGYALGNGFASYMRWDKDDWRSKAARIIGGVGGGLLGMYVGKNSVLPYKAAGPLYNSVNAKFGKIPALIAGGGAMIGGTMMYDSMARGAMNSAKDFGQSQYVYNPSSTGDATRSAYNYMDTNSNYSGIPNQPQTAIT